MKIGTEEELLDELARRLGRPPQRGLAFLSIGRYFEEVLEARGDSDLLERTLEEMVADYRRREERRPAPERTGKGREIAPDVRARALAAILTAEAGQLEEVRSFRRDVLHGHLMEPDKVPGWIERRRARDGKPTVWAMVPLTERGRPVAPGSPVAGTRPTPRRVEVLRYPVPGEEDSHAVSIRADGVLGRLKTVAERLRRFGWNESRGVLFVLTGEPPPLPLARITTVDSWRSHPAAPPPITLEVSPRLNPRRVASLYSEARAKVLGLEARTREMTEERARLAIFAAERNDGRTWDEVMADWNARREGRRYEDVSRFIRDCREAYERITGMPLPWKGTKGPRRERGGRRKQ